MKKEKGSISRREIVKLTAGAIIATPVTQKRVSTRAPQKKHHLFFTEAEYAMVDEMSEMIIPTDDHSPGARAAKAAEFIDQTLGETQELDAKNKWREGLKMINTLSHKMCGKSLMRSTPAERLALLERISQNEAKPQQPIEEFFIELKSRVASAYYSSKIGLRDELEYRGNTYLREYVGVDVSGKS